MKERTLDGFGARLTALRQTQGLTQDELGTAVGISNRMIAYYERDGAQPPGAILVELARVLKVSTDTLLGVTTIKTPRAPKTARLLKRLQQIEELPPADQRTVLKLVDALVDARRRTAPAKRARKVS
jgi:transcriptional regulator with XRE-family HTH domain